MNYELTSLFPQPVMCLAQCQIALLLAACGLSGAVGARFIAGAPFRKHLLDSPNERSSHTEPTPRGGGVGIVAAFLVAGLTLQIPWTVLVSAALVSAVSFYGDYAKLSVRFRLMAQTLSAFIFLFPCLPDLALCCPVSAFGPLPLMSLLIVTCLFVFTIGTANLYNFMDGINGLAGLSGVIAFGLLGIFTLYRPSPDAFQTAFAVLSLGIALACLGYLPFNMPQARVFMGDGGSVFLGFVFAVLVLTLARDCLEMVCFAALLFPFYADELTTMAIRLRDRETLTQPHRRHLYQLLVNECAISHWKVSLNYGVVQLGIGMGILILLPFGPAAVLIFLALCFIIFTFVSTHVRETVRNSTLSKHGGPDHVATV